MLELHFETTANELQLNSNFVNFRQDWSDIVFVILFNCANSQCQDWKWAAPIGPVMCGWPGRRG